MEGPPVKEARDDESSDIDYTPAPKETSQEKPKPEFKIMPKSMLDQLMNRSNIESNEAREKSKKFFELDEDDDEDSDKEKDEDPKKDSKKSGKKETSKIGNDIAKPEDNKSAEKIEDKVHEADNDIDPDSSIEVEPIESENNSVEDILESVGEEIKNLEETSESAKLDFDKSVQEVDDAVEEIEQEDHESDPPETESIQQIIERNFSNLSTTKDGENPPTPSNSSSSNNPPVSPTPPTPNTPNPNIPNGPNGPNIPPIPPTSNVPNPNGPPVPPNIPVNQNFNAPPPYNPNNPIQNPQNPNVINHNTIINPTEYHNTSPTAALLAVDYISHKINKNRIEKTKKKFEKQIDTLKEKQNGYDYAKNELESQTKEQQEKLKRRLETLSDKKEVPLSMNNKSEIYNRLSKQETNVNQKVVQNIENKNYDINNRFVDQKLADPAIEVKPVATFENTLEQIAKAESGGINSEFMYERRHEVMDTPNNQDIRAMNKVSPEFDQVQDQSGSVNLTQSTSAIEHSPSKAKVTREDENVYRQAAITGVWGAIAGLIVFIIFYLLTR